MFIELNLSLGQGSLLTTIKFDELYKLVEIFDKYSPHPEGDHCHSYLIDYQGNDRKPLDNQLVRRVYGKPGLGAPFNLPMSMDADYFLPHPVGLSILDGPAMSMKTLLGEYACNYATQQKFKSKHLHFGEPGMAYILSEEGDVVKLTPAITQEEVFLRQLSTALLTAKYEIIYIDSLKRYVYRSSGSAGTGKGGLNMGLFDSLTSLSIVCLCLNQRVTAILNPLVSSSSDLGNSDESFFSVYGEALKSSVQTTMLIRNQKISYSTRDPRGQRQEKKVSYQNIVKEKTLRPSQNKAKEWDVKTPKPIENIFIRTGGQDGQ